jgi:hypothetical protein
MVDEKTGHLPMYVSYATFINLLDWLGEMPVLPSQLDRSLWYGKFAGGTGSQLMSGLRFLGLLNGERPTDLLEPIVRASGQDRKAALQALLRSAYGSDFIGSLASMTPKMLNEHLEGLGATDATLRKAVSFLITAAKSNDIVVAPGIAKKVRAKSTGRRGALTGTRKPKQENKGEGAKNQNHTNTTDTVDRVATKTIMLRSGGNVTLTVTVDLFGLSTDDRTFVLGLIDKMNTYQAQQQPVEEASNPSAVV